MTPSVTSSDPALPLSAMLFPSATPIAKVAPAYPQ